MKPILYSDYKEVQEITRRSNIENSYQDLMEKEDKVLNTVNNVVKYYREEDMKDGEFVNQPLTTIVAQFFDVWKDVIDELIAMPKTKQSIFSIMLKKERVIYIGMAMVLIAAFLILIESSKW